MFGAAHTPVGRVFTDAARLQIQEESTQRVIESGQTGDKSESEQPPVGV